jgi:hypothetical protein
MTEQKPPALAQAAEPGPGCAGGSASGSASGSSAGGSSAGGVNSSAGSSSAGSSSADGGGGGGAASSSASSSGGGRASWLGGARLSRGGGPAFCSDAQVGGSPALGPWQKVGARLQSMRSA